MPLSWNASEKSDAVKNKEWLHSASTIATPPNVQRGKSVAERCERFFPNPRREEGANRDSQLTSNEGFGKKIRAPSVSRETAFPLKTVKLLFL